MWVLETRLNPINPCNCSISELVTEQFDSLEASGHVPTNGSRRGCGRIGKLKELSYEFGLFVSVLVMLFMSCGCLIFIIRVDRE
jgi:hypothetical protein